MLGLDLLEQSPHHGIDHVAGIERRGELIAQQLGVVEELGIDALR